MIIGIGLVAMVRAGADGLSTRSVNEEVVRACRSLAQSMPPPQPTGVRLGHAWPASPLSRGALFVPPYPAATQAAAQAQTEGRWDRAARLTKIAQQPRAVWLTDPGMSRADTTAQVRAVVAAAYARQQVPTLVVYGLPLRDCGQWSAGGATSGIAYLEWIRAIAAGIRAAGAGPSTMVIMEPDALGLLDRLPADRVDERYDLLRAGTTALTAVGRTAVYLDAGHSGWLSPEETSRRLAAAGIVMARGFALNVSNTQTTDEQIRHGEAISSRLGWKTFVIDTGRNGAGPPRDDEWCNPPGRALGPAPQARSGLVDAYLWVKPPGESDGACRPGEPVAGMFWATYADDLARRAGW